MLFFTNEYKFFSLDIFLKRVAKPVGREAEALIEEMLETMLHTVENFYPFIPFYFHFLVLVSFFFSTKLLYERKNLFALHVYITILGRIEIFTFALQEQKVLQLQKNGNS